MRLPSLDATPLSRAQKGKQVARHSNFPTRDEGSGGQDGIVIPLQLLQESAYQSYVPLLPVPVPDVQPSRSKKLTSPFLSPSVYVVPLQIGSSGQQYLLQVDTGSSDLWLASTACSTSACNNVGGSKYDPSQSLPTGQSTSVDYAQGQVDGPIVWDAVALGGYSIDHQALIAAANVNAEPLSSSFNGVLGLALPLNSQIAQIIPPTTSDSPDGAAFSSNLFGITPLSTAPDARFLSLAFERPGSDKVPSLLGIGHHPKEIVPDPSKIMYSGLVPESVGDLFWKANIKAITVYADGQPKPVPLPSSSTGTNGAPSAILDSGIPLILASPQIAYGIYGALGYGPASDGNFYIPCATPLNISITLDDRSEVFLHPLDLTYFPPDDPSGETCIGAIQTPGQIGITVNQADMILGVPFLRNTYTVLAFDAPLANGSFPDNTGSSQRIEPRLGLLQLTDPAQAAAEFHQVRVLKQPLGASAGSAQGPTKKGLSVGIEVLIGLLGFFGLCFVLFGARLAYMKRRWIRQRRGGAVDGLGSGAASKDGSYVLNELGYHPASRKSDGSEPSEDELRAKRFEAYKRRRELESQYTDDTATTRVGDGEPGVDGEFGALKKADEEDPWADTLVDSRRKSPPPPLPLQMPTPTICADDLPSARRASYASIPAHQRTPSGGPSSAMPLLAAHSQRDSEDIAEFGMSPDGDRDGDRERPLSMAGVGTASRSRRFGSTGSASLSLGSPLLLPQLPPSPLLSPDDRRGSVAFDPLGSPGLGPGPRASVGVFSGAGSRNDSRVSNVGHDS
ncbi:acid protease [Trametes coccinea BRFM310]|uniref:Acid protease n=1 Tax=Trametes coccinea (strain BRFM310) TaxID=1353009 RepID=A0A1Y2IE22_TRAC3|nr:acid protease [Trametes coccinea BRFM310]